MTGDGENMVTTSKLLLLFCSCCFCLDGGVHTLG